MSQKEYRFLTQELRAAGTDAKPKISGYAARYNVKTQLQPGLREVIRPGAFRKTVAAKDDAYACFNHDPQQILGRVRAGSLRLTDDDKGLRFDCDIDLGVSYANDLYRNIQSGAISECSFGFYALNDDYVTDPEDRHEVLREIIEAKVFDVSPVTTPQYGNGVTSVSARNIISAHVEQRARLAAVTSSVVEVNDEQLRWAKSRLELAKRIS